METKLRVVIADDERPARSFLAAMLRRFPDGCSSGGAASGTGGVDVSGTARADLALLGPQITGLDGAEVVRLLRQYRLPPISVVAASLGSAVRVFELTAF